ncbi:MAG TPA: prolipoprotein diacylglyceryl transferase [Candidatus Limnocylindria bacterium]|nr:prolipoprotein diacylglyceryl transferase [Candidatus Limnocylindria bacterium]
MHPEIFHWGFLHIRSYGLMLAIAFLVGTWLALREARRLGLNEDKLVTLILVVLVASVLGARALYVVEHIQEFRREWGSMLALWQGGLTLYGGVVAGTVAGLVAAKRLRLPVWAAADVLAPSFALGTAFGRVGCFLNGCCYGRPTSLPWGVVFPTDSFAGLEFGQAAVHPSQVYLSLAGLALFAVAWWLRRRLSVPGTLFWTVIVLFALLRVPLDFTRAYEPEAVLARIGMLEVTESQLTSVAMALFGTLMILRLRRRTPVPA